MKSKAALRSTVLVIGVVLGVYGTQMAEAQSEAEQPIVREDRVGHPLVTSRATNSRVPPS